MAVFFVANRGFKTDRFLCDFHHLAHFFKRHGQAFGHFFGCRLAPLFVQELAARADQFVDRFDHMHRDTDGPRLIGNRPGDRLTDPPCRISAELVTTAIFKFIDRLHQADIAFLNKVEELQPTVGVFLGNGDHEA